jgi:hypothetical protein
VRASVSNACASTTFASYAEPSTTDFFSV